MFEMKHVKMIAKVILALVVVLFLLGTFTIVDSGTRGLKFTMGELDDNELNEGVAFKVPFVQTIRTLSIQPQVLNTKILVDDNGAITSDNQTVGADITVFYRYQTGKLAHMYREYGTRQIEEIVRKATLESLKQVLGAYTIFNVAIKQNEISMEFKKALTATLTAYPVELTEAKITNYDWSDVFDKQIEETMERAQQVKRTEQELLVTANTAEKQVKEAESSKRATILAAEAAFEKSKLLAKAKEAEGEGIKAFNQAISSNLNIQIRLKELEIEHDRIRKWNGVYVPNNHYGPIPIQNGVLLGK
ncbi:MAG: SPFH domain-containing protein [Sulfurimonas sp.]|jgi:regulator of protease activity HflC (stomatin/prohibitin superfamily)|uniref:prohibitin family protein n=1 Tax=Sulfurimonas sp. TaxID=2022749 RepID=UPI0035678F46